MEQNKFDDNVEFDSVDVSHEHAHAPEHKSEHQPAGESLKVSKLVKYQPFILPGAILIAAILVSGTILYSKGVVPGGSTGDPNEPPAKVKVEVSKDDHVLGDPKAKVTIVEFSDFQCPFCRTFWSDTYTKIKSQYIDTGKVKIVYKHFPLEFHPMALPSALASECAAEQGKFWEMHDKIFQEQDKQGQGTVQFNLESLKKWAGEIGLDTNKFNNCLDSGKYSNEVSKDLSDATSSGGQGTPYFVIGTIPLSGAQPFAAFQQVIEAELNK